jgi:hypothetical protein
MSALAQPILNIRDVIKNIRMDARDEKIPKSVLKRFVHCIDTVSDTRVLRMVTYPLKYILLLSFLAVLSGADDWVDMYTFSLSYKTKLNGIFPEYKTVDVLSHDTFRRVMGLIDPWELQRAVAAFMLDELGQV